jgi:predicted component of type VI protein secretion system
LYGPRDVFGRPLGGFGDPYGPRDVFGRPIGRAGAIVIVEPPRVVSRPPTPKETRAMYGKLADDFKQLGPIMEKKEYGTLSQHAQRLSAQYALPAEARQTIEGVSDQARRLQVLTNLDAQLAASKLPNLSPDQTQTLSPSVRKAVDEWAGVARLKEALSGKWSVKPDATQLKQDLATYTAVTRDGAEAMRLREALALKASREGYAETAQQLTRDIQKVTPPDSGTGKPPSSDRPGMLVPEAPGGPSAAPRESPTEGLPPLEKKVEATAEDARQRATKQVSDEIEVVSHRLHLHLVRVEEFYRRAEQLAHEKDEDKKNAPAADDKPEEAVASALKRPLTPTDRVLLQGMLAKGMKTPAIVAQFRELEAADK